MAYKIEKGRWACSYCGREHPDPASADSCRESHEVIYVAFSKTDLNRLLNFLYTKDESLLTQSLIKTVTKYLRGN